MINGFIRFLKLRPSGHWGFYSNGSKVEWCFFLEKFITNNDHHFFQESRYSKTWKYFFYYFSFLFSALKLILSLKTSAKSRWQKHLTHESIYFMQMLTSKECLHLSKVHSKMEAFMNKNKETTPPIGPLS